MREWTSIFAMTPHAWSNGRNELRAAFRRRTSAWCCATPEPDAGSKSPPTAKEALHA